MKPFEPDREAAEKWSLSDDEAWDECENGIAALLEQPVPGAGNWGAAMGHVVQFGKCGHLEGQRIGWTARGKSLLPLLERSVECAQGYADWVNGVDIAEFDAAKSIRDEFITLIEQIRKEG